MKQTFRAAPVPTVVTAIGAGALHCTQTAYRAPVWPRGCDVVTALFENTGESALEARFDLVLPEEAAVGERLAVIGGRTVIGLPEGIDAVRGEKRPWGRVPGVRPLPGWGNLCILLYNDLNGDAIRQEEEVSILGGAVNVGNRLGTVALSAETLGGGISDANQPTPQELGYVCFEELEPGEYTASAAAPEGYNATTESNRRIELEAGQSTLVAFGAQPDSESVAETALIPESGERSPLLGILGGAFLLLGVGLGVWAALLSRSGKFKRPADE